MATLPLILVYRWGIGIGKGKSRLTPFKLMNRAPNMYLPIPDCSFNCDSLIIRTFTSWYKLYSYGFRSKRPDVILKDGNVVIKVGLATLPSLFELSVNGLVLRKYIHFLWKAAFALQHCVAVRSMFCVVWFIQHMHQIVLHRLDRNSSKRWLWNFCCTHIHRKCWVT